MIRNFLSSLIFVASCSLLTAAPQPNVIFIVCDDLNDSIEHFGGHPQAKTPNMDRLAATGVRFQRAYSNAPICGPSRASFMTGIYPATSGNYGFDKWWDNPTLANSKTIMEFFQENGYHTAGTGKMMHDVRPEEWMEFGNTVSYGPFAHDGTDFVPVPSVPEPFRKLGLLDGSFGPLSDVPFGGKDGKGWSLSRKLGVMHYVSEEDREATPDEANAKWAADFLKNYPKGDKRKPFFLGVGFVRPHTPMVAPKKFFDMFPLDSIQTVKRLKGDADDTHYAEVMAPLNVGPRAYKALIESYGSEEAGLKVLTQAYLACVAAVDECVGEVLDALEESGMAENTIVIVTSDHGYSLGQKNYCYKNSLWEESTRVPMIVRAPGMGQPGTDAKHPVSLIDIYPTLVDLCGLKGDTRKNEKGHALEGYSFRPFIENPVSGKWEGPEGALSVVTSGKPVNGSNHQWSLRTSKWRYILYANGKEELYNHDADPSEWKNLADSPEHAAIKESLLKQLTELRGTVAPPAEEWDWFKAMDTNRNNRVPEKEWLAWSKQSDANNGRKYDEAESKKRFARLDANKDGALTRKEVETSKKK
ncbi:sulfatase-like hydrolase/transferase [Luteolibacter algae]|uniref:Sulfatase-like hydrolase/transferase n=1 Tax=Luteolibacter algae TaxID=454151 RepID=A0ABW5D6A0_9BACT